MLRKVLVMLCAAVVAGSMAGAALAEGASDPGDPGHKQVQHIVVAGDTLTSIAEAAHMDSWRPIWNVNADLKDPNLILVDSVLVIPEGQTLDRPLPDVVLPAQPVSAGYQASIAKHSNPANYAGGADGIFARIRQRESGGNYAANTGNGYYGAYQFDLGTWRAAGGSGLPSQASPAEQDARAAALYSKRGCSPWPNTCG